jgi:TPR repeat protein
VPQDHAAAIGWYRKPADQGDAALRVNLGLFYEKGSGGLPKNERDATRLCKVAAGQGDE